MNHRVVQSVLITRDQLAKRLILAGQSLIDELGVVEQRQTPKLGRCGQGRSSDLSQNCRATAVLSVYCFSRKCRCETAIRHVPSSMLSSHAPSPGGHIPICKFA